MMYPQSPIISTVMYSDYNFEGYPIGTNVIIAVLAYSGFDMEDAIVLNKASLERGLFTDIEWKTVYYDFNELEKECESKVTKVEEAFHSEAKTQIEFKRNPADPHIEHLLDNDGLPHVGLIVRNGDVVLSVHSTKTGIWIYKKYEGKKAARVESVKFLGVSPDSLAGGRKLPAESKKVAITYCMKRVPEVGDKFSNWHGQKGVCGTLLPSEDLPFSASGIVPDIIFNPHSVASRMTIGMLLEIMAAKAALLKGEKYDVEPFKYSNGNMSAADICGKKLKEVGYDFYGEETFYSGTSGEELEATVFCGSAYYLKFCHVVEEKYQVCSVGEVDPKTQQPVNRGKSGAVRFGEMERDTILSHGAVKLTMDRLLHNSDKYTAYICLGCHTMLYPVLQHVEENLQDNLKENKTCNVCRKSKVHKICIPYVLVYLIAELSVMGIKVKFCTEDNCSNIIP
ncbi:DNA-directed RNA polymerase I subunit RPA2, partial [Stegodyphus mimosarum]